MINFRVNHDFRPYIDIENAVKHSITAIQPVHTRNAERARRTLDAHCLTLPNTVESANNASFCRVFS